MNPMKSSRTKFIATAVLGGVLLTSLSGCSGFWWKKSTTPAVYTYEKASEDPFISANQTAARALINQAQNRLYPDQSLIVATLVDINVLEKSSTLGRIASEQISAVFSQTGYRMVEMKFRENVYIKRNEGELLLTREINEIAKLHKAQAVIVGSYGVGANAVFINLKLVQPGTNVILAAYDYAVPMDGNTRALLGYASRGSSPYNSANY